MQVDMLQCSLGRHSGCGGRRIVTSVHQTNSKQGLQALRQAGRRACGVHCIVLGDRPASDCCVEQSRENVVGDTSIVAC